MNSKADAIDTLTTEIPAGTPAEPGYEAWLKSQLVQAVADLDEPAREEIGHEAAFERLDALIARHEAS